jgi:hypothetical protein
MNAVEKVRVGTANFLAEHPSPITPEMQKKFDKLMDKLKAVLKAGPFHDQPVIQLAALNTLIASELASWPMDEETRREFLELTVGAIQDKVIRLCEWEEEAAYDRQRNHHPHR